uniref:Transcription factor CBF/NF-Y/archaeal histone domain-containing protein n=1 Tax=Setaria digitata TaxID=48799 RepID=A0A915PIE0_9BILA
MALQEDSDSNDDDQLLAAFRKFDHSENEAPTSSSSGTLNAQHELPLARVKTIMQSGGEQVPISSEGLFAMTKAAELFVCKLARESYESNDKPKCIEYSHLADYIQDNDKLEFLHEMVPHMVRFADVMHLVQPSAAQTRS